MLLSFYASPTLIKSKISNLEYLNTTQKCAQSQWREHCDSLIVVGGLINPKYFVLGLYVVRPLFIIVACAAAATTKAIIQPTTNN